MKSLLAIPLATLALSVAACGDDNGDKASTTGTVATTGTTTGKTTTGEDKKKSASNDSSSSSKSKSGSSSGDSKSSGSSKSSSGESESAHKRSPKHSGTTNSGRGSPTDAPSQGNQNANKSKPLYTKKSAENAASQSIAKRICKSYLPKLTQKALKSGKKTKQQVAQDYSKGWPADKRKYAYRGCLQGLRAGF